MRYDPSVACCSELVGLTALTLAVPGLAGTSNPGFHGISQVFYEFTSAYANNGSGFEGLADNTVWWNLSCALVLALGRFPILIIPPSVWLFKEKVTWMEIAGALISVAGVVMMFL